MPTTKLPQIANSPEKIQLSRISHVYLSHPDLSAFESFAKDFGFIEEARDGSTIYYRGFGKDSYAYVASQSETSEKAFDGGAFLAKTEDDFNKAVRLDGAVLTDLAMAPGGGRLVTVPTPSGSKIHVLWGAKERTVPLKAPSATTVKLGPYNTTLEKFRKGEFQRFTHGPAMVHKLGHYGFVSAKFDEDVHFYTSNFNFVPSDVLYMPGNFDMDVLVFFHLDLGDDFSDHHSLFLQRAPPGAGTTMHHCSFEVEDFDTQLIGHEWLLSNNCQPVWGVGRHILGSQIFDYWKDPSGFTIEHYADGDLVNQASKTQTQEAGPDTLSIWGPKLPESFGG
ncbi:hypothetical protein V502_02031 [Pseudogymnoascus sp. VKM F-4520 (FW-2644)]|nr:hypothetical protein V502_02031 [Pseudogymnoascus sp. VKM F-4520 (FW-2644)]